MPDRSPWPTVGVGVRSDNVAVVQRVAEEVWVLCRSGRALRLDESSRPLHVHLPALRAEPGQGLGIDCHGVGPEDLATPATALARAVVAPALVAEEVVAREVADGAMRTLPAKSRLF